MSLFTLLTGALLMGGGIGFVSHLIRNKNKMVRPRKLKYSFDMGFWADIIYGGVAAVLTVTYLLPIPEDYGTLIAYSILAGMSAQSVLLYRKLDTEQSKTKHDQKLSEIENRPLDLPDTKSKKKESE